MDQRRKKQRRQLKRGRDSAEVTRSHRPKVKYTVPSSEEGPRFDKQTNDSINQSCKKRCHQVQGGHK